MIPELAIPGLPPWVANLVFVALCVAVLAFLLMPFAVFGLKGRMEALESQMEALRDEMAALRAAIAQSAPLAPPPSAFETDSLPQMTSIRRGAAAPTRAAPVPPPPVRAQRAPRDAEEWARREPRL